MFTIKEKTKKVLIAILLIYAALYILRFGWIVDTAVRYPAVPWIVGIGSLIFAFYLLKESWGLR